MSQALDAHLAALEASGLIRPVVTPNRDYLFRHSLVQEAAYGSLLKADRRVLHRWVGESLESLASSQLDEVAPVLAWHFSEAGEDRRALHYFTLAGDAAQAVYANVEALAHYTRALDLAKRLADPEQLAYLCVRRGRALELSNRNAEALVHYEAMGALAQARGDPALELLALIGQAVLRAIPNPLFDLATGRALCEQAMVLARQLDDRAAQSKILWVLMMGEVFAVGDPQQAIRYGEQSLALARELNLREQMAYTLNDLFRAYTFGGRLQAAHEALAQARPLWEEAHNLPLLADTLANFSRIHYFLGNFEQTILDSTEAFELSRRAHNPAGQVNSRFSVGGAYTDIGAIGEGIEVLTQALDLGRQYQHVSARSYLPAELAWAYALLGDFPRSLALAREACEIGLHIFLLRAYARIILARVLIRCGGNDLAEAEQALASTGIRGRWKFSLPHIPVVAGLAEVELAVARRQWAEADAWLAQLLAYLQTVPIRPYVPEALYWQGRLCRLQPAPDLDRAYRCLTQARAEAEALGSRRLLWPILVELAELAASRQQTETAAVLRREARAVIAYFADHCPPGPSSGSGPSLRDSFLNLPEVQRALADA